jgi:hypothetical protein
MKNYKVERRKHPRITTYLPLELEHDALSVMAETRDLSCTGVYCQTEKPLPLMSKVAIVMFLPYVSPDGITASKKIRCKGVVVRSEPTILAFASCAHHNIAIFFTDLSEADQKIIAQYVEDNLSKTSTLT